MGENNRDYVTRPDEKGSINISEDVIAFIAGNAALEIEGVASLSASFGKDIAELLGKKNLSKGVRVTSEGDNIKVDIYIMVKMGVSVSKVGMQVQEAVASNIESMTGISVSEVNIHVCGVAFDRDR